MTTSRLIGIIAIALVLLVIFSFLPAKTNPEDQGAQAVESLPANTGADNLADFIGREGSYVCVTAYEDEQIVSAGTVYVAGNRFRADFESEIMELATTIDTHSIWDGETVWSWSDASALGTQAPASAESIVAGQGQGEAAGYTCREEFVSESLFEIPENIIFEHM